MLREFLYVMTGMFFTLFWITSLRANVSHITGQIQTIDLFNKSTKVQDDDLFFHVIKTLKQKPPLLNKYILRDEICEQLLRDYEYLKMPEMSKYIVKVEENSDEQVISTCDAIRQRAFYPSMPFSKAEKKFPIAYVRIVYKNFHLQELMLNLMYAPQNLFCYALDAKSSTLFHEHMKNLSRCFPNVFLTDREYEVDSSGHNTSKSFLECLRIIRKLPDWKYAILLQNNDIPLKSNREMVQILSILNGSNDINVGYPNADRVPKDAPWTFQALNLFYDEKENDHRKLRIAKGSTSVSLSREFVEFVIDKLNLTILLDKFNQLSYGMDEMLFPSLHSEDALNIPGGFTRQCIDVYNNMITRYVVWKKSSKRCRSGYYRHDICVFGIGDLPTMTNSMALFANKMLPEYDYTAIGCWAHALYNRTYSPSPITSTKLKYYANRLPVRFHNERKKWQSNLSTFNCSTF